jgi:hypothetical protein
VTETSASAGHPALDYAERVLGVHKVYEEANALLVALDGCCTSLDEAIDARRALDDKISDYEMDILIAERGKHADMSQAGMDRHLKEVYHKDETLKRLRMERNAKAGEASGLELDQKFIEWQLKVKVGRMEELGGYFHFLAVTKQAEASAPPAS